MHYFVILLVVMFNLFICGGFHHVYGCEQVF